MADAPKRHKTHVIGPKGEILTLADLPPADTRRWVMSRKAVLVAAVKGGLISLEDACERYNLSAAEFFSWHRAIEQSGVAGLRVTRQPRNPGTKGSPAKKD